MSKDKIKSYIRIGYNFKKIVNLPLMSGDSLKVLRNWQKHAIKDDHPGQWPTIIKNMPKYWGTVVRPGHLNYQREINGFYNLYEPLQMKPCKGSCEKIIEYLKHIFYDDIELGFDYLKILYLHPAQALPVLCLISEERKTGKTTFIDLLKLIFNLNMTINSTHDFESQFNSDMEGKLLIAIEEVLFKSKEETEKIKHLSTAKSFKSESKGVDRQEVDFFGKFILLSNHETTFINIDPGEDRFWVIKVNSLKKENPNLLIEMEKEIPAFLQFLMDRPFFYPRTTRMWFDFKLYETKALRAVINHNNKKMENELMNIMMTIIETFDVENISFSLGDITGLINNSFRRVQLSKIRKMIKKWDLEQAPNCHSYTKYYFQKDGTLVDYSAKGRYYTVTKEWIENNYKELMNE